MSSATRLNTIIPSNKITQDINVLGNIVPSGKLHNNIIDASVQTQVISRKRLPVSSYANTSIASFSNANGGMITRIWLALNGVGISNIFFRITIDGELVIGNMITTQNNVGMNTNPLTVQFLFTPVTFAGAYQSKHFGCNICNTTQMGGYVALNMPFKSSFDISMYNPTGDVGEYWSQSSFEINRTPIYNTIPLFKLHVDTFQWTGSYPNEYPLLNMTGPQGVYLKGLRIRFVGVSGAWGESRFKIYTGTGQGFNNAINTVRYDDNLYTTPLGYDSQSKVIVSGSGVEDFFDSSYNFLNSLVPTVTDRSGYLYLNYGSTGQQFDGGSTMDQFLIYGTDSSSLPSCQSNETLTLAFPMGDPRTGASGNCTIIGHVFYYK